MFNYSEKISQNLSFSNFITFFLIWVYCYATQDLPYYHHEHYNHNDDDSNHDYDDNDSNHDSDDNDSNHDYNNDDSNHDSDDDETYFSNSEDNVMPHAVYPQVEEPCHRCHHFSILVGESLSLIFIGWRIIFIEWGVPHLRI